jgi:hypothetical protein
VCARLSMYADRAACAHVYIRSSNVYYSAVAAAVSVHTVACTAEHTLTIKQHMYISVEV